MDINKLKHAESAFFAMYPQGFNSPEMVEISKKHKMKKHVAFAEYAFGPESFGDAAAVAKNMIRLVSRSSMVSMFEKPKFREMVHMLAADELVDFTDGLKALLHGDEAEGFYRMLAILQKYGLGKWTLMTVWRCYVHPNTDLLFKPTTVKRVISYFALDGLVYKPQPNYDFFVNYRQAVQTMATAVSPWLSPSLAAFSGFLMMSTEMNG